MHFPIAKVKRSAEFFILSISYRIPSFFTFTLASSPGWGILRMFNIAWNRCRIRRKIQNVDADFWGGFLGFLGCLVDPSMMMTTAYIFQRTIVSKKKVKTNLYVKAFVDILIQIRIWSTLKKVSRKYKSWHFACHKKRTLRRHFF